MHEPLVLEYSETRSLREKGCAFERYNNINNETIDDHVEHVWTCCDSILYMDPTSRLTWTVNVQLAQQTVFAMASLSGEKSILKSHFEFLSTCDLTNFLELFQFRN